MPGITARQFSRRHTSCHARALQGLKYLRPQEQVESNIITLAPVDRSAERYCELLKQRGVLSGPASENRGLLVFYREIGDREAEEAVSIIRALAQRNRSIVSDFISSPFWPPLPGYLPEKGGQFLEKVSFISPFSPLFSMFQCATNPMAWGNSTLQ